MPHKCVQCGRDYKDASPVILRGCESCGGRKFLFVRENDRNKDIMLEQSAEALAKEAPDQVLVVNTEPDAKTEFHDRIESIRIIAPGTYELNIEKLANSDERVVGIGSEGNYLLDLHSMIKPGKDKKSRKKS
jgi:predicted  nucleic acid-binding Zn-ribbon protein